MAILFAGTSIADMGLLSGATSSETSIPTNVKEGIRCTGVDAVLPTFTPTSDLWFTEHLLTSISTGAGGTLLGFNGPSVSNRMRIALGISAPRGQIYFQVWRSGAWVTLATSTLEIPSTIVYRWDFHIKLHASAGVIEVWVNGTSFLKFEGNTAPSDGVDIHSVSLGTRVGGVAAVHSSIIVADEDVRSLTMTQRLPTGNGAETSWTGDYTAVDETGVNDTDYISTTTPGAKETFTFPALPAEYSSLNFRALILGGRSRGGGDPNDILGVARIAGVNYTTFGKEPTPVAFGSQQWVFNLNPATGQRWTGAEIDAAQFGVEAA